MYSLLASTVPAHSFHFVIFHQLFVASILFGRSVLDRHLFTHISRFVTLHFRFVLSSFWYRYFFFFSCSFVFIAMHFMIYVAFFVRSISLFISCKSFPNCSIQWALPIQWHTNLFFSFMSIQFDSDQTQLVIQ